MQIAEKTNWPKMLANLESPKKDSIKHFFIITNYKEDIKKLKPSIDALVECDFPAKNKYLVLALEDREGIEAKNRAEQVIALYKNDFSQIVPTYHPIVAGEIIGKASNESYAGKIISRIARENHFDPKYCLVTTMDADSLLPVNYCSYLAHKYLVTKDKEYKFYWGPVLLYNNFWKLILPVRVQSIISSVIRLSLLTQEEDLIQISSYSMSLWLLEEIGYWDVDIIPEDWHVFLQAFFTFGEKVKTIPLFTPISGDPVHTTSFWSTIKNRYEQEKRWAWGVTDIPYAVARALRSPHVPWLPKLRKIALLSEIHVFWPTSFFLLFIGAFVPSWVNESFSRTTLGFLLPKISSSILTLSSGLLLVFAYFDYRLRKKINIPTHYSQIPLLFIQWYFLPLISFLFSSLPALEAHTRLLIGRKIEYKVTEKA